MIWSDATIAAQVRADTNECVPGLASPGFRARATDRAKVISKSPSFPPNLKLLERELDDAQRSKHGRSAAQL
jgi:hypothetical protein